MELLTGGRLYAEGYPVVPGCLRSVADPQSGCPGTLSQGMSRLFRVRMPRPMHGASGAEQFEAARRVPEVNAGAGRSWPSLPVVAFEEAPLCSALPARWCRFKNSLPSQWDHAAAVRAHVATRRAVERYGAGKRTTP